MTVSLDELRAAAQQAQGASYVELRFHARTFNEIRIAHGELEEARSTEYTGVGARVLVTGAWGFSSTNLLDRRSLGEAVRNAVAVARVAAEGKHTRVENLAEGKLAQGTFRPIVNDSLDHHSLEEKVRIVREAEETARKFAPEVKTASCAYGELLDHKLIFTSDGAAVELHDTKPEFRVLAVAGSGSDMTSALEARGVTGGWADLFGKVDPAAMARRAAETAVKLFAAKLPKGERTTIILDPGMAGLISHEAIGHTVEADFVLSGSAVKDKLGQGVASEQVTLVDSGPSDIQPAGAGTIAVDDEGVIAQRTVVIDHGILRSYLHNRETAGLFGVAPTGNARAFEYSDEPLIRMRNTFIEAGPFSLDELVEDVQHGYLIKGPRNGQADANGEFMFGAQEAYLIEHGQIGSLMRGPTISGNAFEVLQSVDGISRDFALDMGAGYCGKWQLMKVDGGGGYIRCKALVGGLQ